MKVCIPEWICGKVVTVKGSFNVTLTVEPAAEPLAVATPEDLGVVGQMLLSGLQITGGTPPYTVTLTGGTMPDGLTLNPDGSFAGTTTAPGSFDIAVDVADSLG